MSDGKDWAAMAVSELGKACGEIAWGVAREDLGGATIARTKAGMEHVQNAMQHLSRALVILEIEHDRSPK